MTPSTKRVCILGSTGSIGRRTLDVVRDFPDRFRVVALSARSSTDALLRQAEEFRPEGICATGAPLPSDLPRGVRAYGGDDGVLRMLEETRPDFVVSAMVGAAGLMPTLRALELGATVGLANKETLVAAGRCVMETARRRGASILPIDSEHNAIFQCLHGQDRGALRRIVLTASGGPFRGWPKARLETATLEQALRHPTWAMGRKITIDSATLMNKGFEAIEAHHLFDADADALDVVVHPQSVVHSMVEFVDGSILAQLGATDMYLPIANVLAHPERLPIARVEPLDPTRLGSLTFEPPDREAFPCLDLAFEAIRRGGAFGAALNAANEVAVDRFLAGAIRFVEIPELIRATLEAHDARAGAGDDSLGAVLETDAWARRHAASIHFSPA